MSPNSTVVDTSDSRDVPLLATLETSREQGFLGKGPVAAHLEHARGLIDAIPSAATSFLDLGSGGGIPGLVIAWDRPSLTGTLLDGSTRRGTFLSEAVDRLGLSDRISVVVERAEVAARSGAWRGQFEVVVARSFGPPAVVAECAAPFIDVGGLLIVSDPPSSDDWGARWPESGLGRVGLEVLRRVEAPPSYTVMVQTTACPDRYPRRVGVPAKRPLF